MAARFRREPPRRLSCRLHHITGKPAASKDGSVLGSASRNATAVLSGKIDDMRASLTGASAEVDVIVIRKRMYEVPRGRRVSERMWTALNNKGSRRVTFSPIVEAKLVPSKEECYPTPLYKAACFFPKHHKDIETKRISTGGPGQAEWLLLLFETRQAAAEDRKKQQERRELREDKENAGQTGGKQGGGNGGCVTGSSVPEARRVPETEFSGWRGFVPLPVEKDKGRGLFKAARSFRAWVARFCTVSWTPPRQGGGDDSRFDWLIEFPSDLQHDIV
eukprot:g10026.t1